MIGNWKSFEHVSILSYSGNSGRDSFLIPYMGIQEGMLFVCILFAAANKRRPPRIKNVKIIRGGRRF